MKGPLNQFKEEVCVGDTVVLTTTHWKRSSTRVARVVRLEQGSEKDKWDYTLKRRVPTGEFHHRVFVRLYNRQQTIDPITKRYIPDTYSLVPYVKEVFGIGESVKIDPSTLPTEVQEVLNGRK